MSDMIVAEGLAKHYGKVTALDGVDLRVPAGTVLGLLGPNGAGKTTAVRSLPPLLRPDTGRATVAGHDVLRDPAAVRKVIGLSGQYAAVDEHLTGRENLDMVGRLFHLGGKASQARAAELLERFDLVDAADRVTKTYSGGMRRRLDLAASLVARPQVIFLDEPTTGLDPRSRLGMWDVIRELVREGATLLLTTQYLEEADALADNIAIIDSGKLIAQGTANELKAQVGGERVELVVADRSEVPKAVAALESLATADPVVDEDTHMVTVQVSGGTRALADVVRELDTAGVVAQDLAFRRPTLDEVFLSLTGHSTEEGS
ncbi:MAG: daunorubicin resistance protein DrrA family transporter ATP-binding protein [Actinoallomurus sp.]|nr:daunorubicin resistance protein DrrA family transporter ATP-binding protein [Actinoallomurus sp.]